jgi:hypothetical protein
VSEPEQVDFATVLDWVEGRLDPAAAARVADAAGYDLLFDSRQDVALVDLRDADADADIAHLAFTSDPADVVLDVRRLGPGRVRIEGQVLPADGADRAYAVEATGPRMTAVHSVGGDRQGRFVLPELPDRVDRLRLDSGELVLLVQFDVGWSRS